ncbi:DNA polymerase III subunit delta [Paucibacter sp. PLA-PC-4]|uniref:DNA polymerase III subunit delta n=1 Tax=Paucibacter sp. PLA-PC-4 TaxID=2993655 RepID=UPI00224AB225|nr:DNA polymerase III subunit delta [Paucibacter sp. PLA-PC-4]MCX2863981.1 DNA polymerase III subunit delta [Paucibacter sp. PLA-PC-4]
MQIRADALAPQLAKGLRPIYTVFGDEPLLAQEACDAIRAAARAQGYGERKVFTVSGAYFDWGPVLGAAQALSLFAERQFIEIRIPSGKPGKDGSEALQRYCERLPEDVVTLVSLPRLDKTQMNGAWFGALDVAGITVRVDPVDRRALPQWIAQRLAAQGQPVQDGEDGQRTLSFFADRVEGNLLAAHQELQKLALLHPKGELSFEQIEAAVLNVARYDVFKLSEAVLAGQLGRVLRMLDGLQAEGEAAVLVHWALAEDIRALRRVREAVDAGKPLPMALREARVWGPKERMFERIVPGIKPHSLSPLVEAAQICDGIVKGLRHPGWPLDPWAALQRLALMLVEVAAAPRAPKLALRP